MSLEEIRVRVDNTPRMAAWRADDYQNGSIYELADGLEMLVQTPGYYSDEAQNSILDLFVNAVEDRARLLAALDAVCKAVPSICESNADDEMEDGARSVANWAIKDWTPSEY